MAIERIFDIQGFTGGESDDIYKGPKDSFYQAEGVEIRKNLSGATLASALVDTGWDIDGTITCIENLQTLGIGGTSPGIIVCTSTGKIYLNGVLKQTISTGIATNYNIVIGIGTLFVSGTQYIYYISKTATGSGVGQIHKSTTDLATFTISHRNFTTSGTGSSPKAIVLDFGNRLLFGINDKIFELDNTETVIQKLDFRNTEEIRGFTYFQNNYRIYTNNGINGVHYFWDGLDLEPYYRQVWINQPILGIVNDGAIDYAILGFNSSYSDLYLISGTQKQELRVNLEGSTNSRILDGYLSIREGIIYISGGKTGESNNYGVYSYGNYYPGTAKSLVQEFSGTTNTFLGHCHGIGLSYMACSDGNVYTIEHNNPPTINNFASTGYIVSPLYQGNLWEEKAIKKIKIGFKIGTGTSIKIYLRTSLGGSWLLAKTIDYTIYGSKKHCTIFENEIKALNIGNFNELQIKVELIGATSNTPIISRITTFMEVINNQ